MNVFMSCFFSSYVNVKTENDKRKEPNIHKVPSIRCLQLQDKYKPETQQFVPYDSIDNISMDMSGYKDAYNIFIRNNPDYLQTVSLDMLRTKEFSRLNTHIYLDYTGAALYPESLVEHHMNNLITHVYGNTHSVNPTSLLSNACEASARNAVLNYLNASSNHYEIIFTQNASHALKLVGESYPFSKGSQYLLTYDAHNSLNGIRHFAANKGAKVRYVTLSKPDLRIDDVGLTNAFNKINKNRHNLFALTAQSNFSGVKHPLEHIERAQALGWDVCLDAAAYCPTNKLDLSKYSPDFVAISIYKITGYPTGIGCLIARKDTLQKMRRPWYAGGTVNWALIDYGLFEYAAGPRSFEDGTINFLSLVAIPIALTWFENIDMNVVQIRIMLLTQYVIHELKLIKHSNGMPVIKIYGPQNTDMRGGTIAMSMLNRDGSHIPLEETERRALSYNISLRTGCMCNPGTSLIALSDIPLQHKFTNKEDLVSHLKIDGVTRISIGIVTNFADVYTFIQFVKQITH